MVVWVDGWRCPYCKTEYLDFNVALRCTDECRDSDEPEPVSLMVCEFCRESYLNEEDAIDCEEDHERLNDKFYQDYLVKKNFSVLKKASEFKGQKKLL